MTTCFWTTALLVVASSFLPAQGKPAVTPGAATSGAGQPTAGDRSPAEAAANRGVSTSPRIGVPVIGVFDLGKAYDNYPKAKTEHERLNKLKDQFDDQLQQFSAHLEELRGSMKVLNEGSPQFRKAQMDLEIGQTQGRALASHLKEELQIEVMRVDLDLYADIEVAIEQVAKDRGVQLVLRSHSQPELPAKMDPNLPKVVQARLSNYEQRQVWFCDDTLDLTPALIRRLQTPIERKAMGATTGKDDAGQTPAQPERGSK